MFILPILQASVQERDARAGHGGTYGGVEPVVGRVRLGREGVRLPAGLRQWRGRLGLRLGVVGLALLRVPLTLLISPTSR